MYVGITRARRRLVLSRAWYYRDNIGPKEPSPFWDEALATGLVAAESVDCPPENPYPVGVEAQPDPERASSAPPADPAEVARLEAELERLREVEAKQPPAPEWRVPTTLSVTAFLTFVRDPDEFFRRYVRRVPSPPSPAAKLGTELHRRIELHARGVAAVGGLPEDVEEPYDLDPGERKGGAEPVSAEQLWENFQRSRFAQMKPLMVEQPFTLYIGEGIIDRGPDRRGLRARGRRVGGRRLQDRQERPRPAAARDLRAGARGDLGKPDANRRGCYCEPAPSRRRRRSTI